MAGNTLGKLFTVTTFGESHGPALGCIIDGCPPGLGLNEEDIQIDLDRRRPGQSKYTSQRRELDQVEIVSGVFDGITTGTPIGLIVRNNDARSRDYASLRGLFRPGHADYTYHKKYGHRDYRGGGDACLCLRRRIDLVPQTQSDQLAQRRRECAHTPRS